MASIKLLAFKFFESNNYFFFRDFPTIIKYDMKLNLN